MTERTNQPNTITVPVGFGGKCPPYVPDPAPTLLVELSSVDRAREEAKIQSLLRAAEADAARIRSGAEAAADELLVGAETEAAALVETARSSAAAITAAAETAAEEVRASAEESLESARAELDVRQRELDERTGDLEERSAALDEREADLERRESLLEERRTVVDAEVDEAAALLAGAHSEAGSVLAEARTAAEEILESARQQADEDARRVIAEARVVAENDSTVADRIAEIESIHRIEVQVLHDRELELMERIAELERRVDAASVPPPAQLSDAESPDENGSSRRDSADSGDDSVSIDLDAAEAEVVASQSRPEGRHAAENRSSERLGPVGIASHAPLTEQLSISAFRAAQENDRRGRRRR